ncbi:MAG TPA: Lrp/AsnC family transcriptional regulator, partial [Vicinamibacteria bacterium]|nr:Lrp/AsnC family transcriptional regulator [Vicinamibacteria bacterium]
VSMSAPIDFIDRQILKALLSKGRSTFAELAAQVGLTAPTVHDRVKKLERTGVIEAYSASVNPSTLGYEISAFIGITTTASVSSREYEARLNEISEIQECFSVAGEETYMARVITKNPRSLELLLQRIKEIPGTLSTRTTVVLSATISRHTFPLEDEIREFPGEPRALARSHGAR